jgi:DUF4097 and DUF4098 domain-containing protein YvlB
VSAFGDLPRHASIEVASRSANIVIRAADVPAPTVVRGRAEIDATGVVHVRSDSSVEIHCPPGTDVCVASTSGKVTCEGLLGRVWARSTSGDVRIEQAESIDVRTTSAKVDIGTCAGACDVVGHSGRIEIGATRSASVSTTSGRTTIDSAVDACVRSASGAVHVGARKAGVIEISTLSGSVKVQLADGCNPLATLRSLSGKVRGPTRQAVATDGDLRVRTMSGSITVE